jgi:hypothetical protein
MGSCGIAGIVDYLLAAWRTEDEDYFFTGQQRKGLRTPEARFGAENAEEKGQGTAFRVF